MAAIQLTPTVKIDSSRPAISESDIKGLEKRNGITLPTDYRAFLLQTNGGRIRGSAGESLCIEPKWSGQPWARHYDRVLVGVFYSIVDDVNLAFSWDGLSAEEKRDRYVFPYPQDAVPIGHNTGPDQFLLGVSGANRGKVFFWAMDQVPVEDDAIPDYGNVGWVADSFADFLARLKPCPPDWKS